MRFRPFFASAPFVLAAAAHADPTYSIEWLRPTTSSTVVVSINASGQVLGTNASGTFVTSPVGAASTTYAYTAGITPTGGLQGGPELNDAGQFSGRRPTTSNSFPYHAVRTTSGGYDDFGVFPGGVNSQGNAINRSGQVTGSGDGPNGSVSVSHGFRTYGNGVSGWQDLGGLANGYGAQGFAINDGGEVTGQADTGTGDLHAFRSSANGPTVTLTDLGSFGSINGHSTSYGYAINASGVVVGSSNAGSATAQHAFRSSPTGSVVTLTDINGTASTSAGYGLDSRGNVVGSAILANTRTAFLYTDHMISLQTATQGLLLGDFLEYAVGINENGVIVGNGERNGVQVGFRLIPTPVPEPVAAFALLPALAVLRRRRR